MLFCGINQCAANLPSYLEKGSDFSGTFRTFAIYFGLLVAALVDRTFRRLRGGRPVPAPPGQLRALAAWAVGVGTLSFLSTRYLTFPGPLVWNPWAGRICGNGGAVVDSRAMNDKDISGTETSWTTQMDAARKGVATPQLLAVAGKERMAPERLMALVAEGKVAIPANRAHACLSPEGIGSALRTKINVNLGVSRDCRDYDVEMKKVMSAVELGAEAIMDLSSHGDTRPFRRRLVAECPAMIGTVPVYDAVIHYQRDLGTLTARDFVDVVRLHAEDGVDFVTLHCGITRKTVEQIRAGSRKMNIVSRGGSLVFAWMSMTGEENPFYQYYDEILDICERHDVTVSLGDACRPGCLADATDGVQIEELVRLGELTERAWRHNVQVMVEGPGHVPLDQVAANMQVQRTICHGAPFYVLGPLVTDIAPGYDHITAAIGGAVAAMNGAAFLCYVTPAEHLALPNVDDVRQGIVASKIAAHAADVAKGLPGARDRDDRMAEARRRLDWEAQFAEAIDPATARAIRDARLPEDDHADTCSMCGKFCAVRSMNKALAGETIDIL